jgi:cell division septal protein FtsQ
VRFDLAGGDKKAGKRRKRKRSRTFRVAVAQPQIQPRRGAQKRRSEAQRRSPQRQPKAQEASAPRRAVSWRQAWARLPVVLLLGGLIALVVYASSDSKFFVYAAQISGVRHLDTKAVYRAAGVDEQNIFWIRPEQVAERIAQLDGVAAVRVHCALPARVSIEVTERDPVVMWRAASQGHDWWLDEEGVVLPYDGDVEHTIFVVDSSERSLAVGDRIEPKGIVRSVQQLAEALPGTTLFFYDAERGLSFRQEENGGQWPVYVGSSEDLPRKIQAMQTLTDYLGQQNIRPSYVDVRWAAHPVFHVSAGTEAGGGD